MITLKTNTEVIIKPRTEQTEYVYMEILDIVYNGEWCTARLEYYYKDENDNKVKLEDTTANFTKAEAGTIEDGVQGGLQGAHLLDKFDSLIYAGIMYQLSVQASYGLGVSGWSIV